MVRPSQIRELPNLYRFLSSGCSCPMVSSSNKLLSTQTG